ncbi:hypothetical protein EAV90_02900 [Bradyrhizobium vignae]|nr:hypothetical protein EAV90_02900 [Bradyrhizobium vignae]
MPGLVQGIHILCAVWQDVDGRDEPGHDGAETAPRASKIAPRTGLAGYEGFGRQSCAILRKIAP